MLLALVYIYQIAVTFANPFNKNSFAVLVNAGNEEFDNANTEQIRVAVPGGSVALRYPAYGNGDTLTNVVVIGIDFVKNLKAQIVDGGPGYNYVVIALSGDTKVPYDVLVTLQTIPDTKNMFDDVNDIRNYVNSDPYGVDQDNNDSAEDTRDNEPSNYNYKKVSRINAEEAQASSHVYDYGMNKNAVFMHQQYKNEDDTADDENGDDDDGDDDDENDDDDDENKGNEFENEVNKNSEDEDEDDDTDNTDDIAYSQDIHRPNSEQFSNKQDVKVADSDISTRNQEKFDQTPVEDKYNDYDYDDTKVKQRNLFTRYGTPGRHLDYDNDVQQQSYNTYNQKNDKNGYQDDPSEIDQMFNDEEVHGKYVNDNNNNNNNNNYDTNDASAVEY